MNGNVGVGTIAPNAGIDVVGGGTGIGFSKIAQYSTETWSLDAVVVGDRMYAADGNRLDIFDITHPATQVLLSGYDFGAEVTTVRVAGNFAYVSVNNILYVLDISMPTHTPILLGTYATNSSINDLQVQNGFVYVVDSYGLYDFDVSQISLQNPSAPILVSDGVYGTDASPIRLAVSGNYAYLSEQTNELKIINISDPSNPQVASTYTQGNDAFVGGVAVSGNYVYFTRDTNDGQSFVVLDVSNPLAPVKVASMDIGSYRANTRVVISGNIAYVADAFNDDSVFLINISYPANPILLGHATTDGISFGVAPFKDGFFVAEGPSGIEAYSTPINYAALFNNGNVGIGTNDPGFTLDVSAVKATATLTLTAGQDADGFELTDNTGAQWTYEFDNNNSNSGSNYVINLLDGNSNTLSLTKLIDVTTKAINDSGKFTATRTGNAISVQQLAAGASGNVFNYLYHDTDTMVTHPTHHSTNILLTDFINGTNGDINFGGQLYQNGSQFMSSQWATVEGGISYDAGSVAVTAGDVNFSGGNFSVGGGALAYDNTTGVTSIDNLLV